MHPHTLNSIRVFHVHKNAFFHVLICRIADFSCAFVHMRLKKIVPDRQKLCILHQKKPAQHAIKKNQ